MDFSGNEPEGMVKKESKKVEKSFGRNKRVITFVAPK